MGAKGRKKARKRSVSMSVSVLNEQTHEQWWNEEFIKAFGKLACKKLEFNQDFGFKVAMMIAVKAIPLKIQPEKCAKLAIGLYDDFIFVRRQAAKDTVDAMLKHDKMPVDESAETKHGD